MTGGLASFTQTKNGNYKYFRELFPGEIAKTPKEELSCKNLRKEPAPRRRFSLIFRFLSPKVAPRRMKYASRGDFGDSAQILRRPGLHYLRRPKTEIRFSKKASSRKVCNTSKECAALTKSKEETRLMPGFFYFSVFYRQNPPSAYNVRLSVGYLTILRKLCSVRRSLEGRGGRGKKQTRNFGRTRPRPSDTPYRRADMSCRRQQPPTTEDVQTQGNTPRRGDQWSPPVRRYSTSEIMRFFFLSAKRIIFAAPPHSWVT